jgi:hypothetical protein
MHVAKSVRRSISIGMTALSLWSTKRRERENTVIGKTSGSGKLVTGFPKRPRFKQRNSPRSTSVELGYHQSVFVWALDFIVL